MLDFLILYAIAFVTFFVVDLVWLGLVAKPFYDKHLGHLLRQPVNWTAAIIFYLMFIAGLVFFAILPAVEAESVLRALLYGGAFGLITYATYDLTNLATLKDWPLKVTVVDLAWGTCLGTVVTTITYLIYHLIF
ncbi:MAG: DUF2177 family protein [Acholeplasmatales bacterium]|nr:MAG: DUF2177 family protein [Acholeplasmatales bacterium]